MGISDLLKDPTKLEEVFEKALDRKDTKTINLLLPYIENPRLIYLYAKK